MLALTLTHACAILLLFWAPQNIIQFLVTNWCSLNLFFLKWLCGLSYQTQGLNALKQTIKEQGRVVLMSKHQSTMETLILQSVLTPKPALVLKKELLNIPFYGWALSRLKPIAINRKERSSAMEQVIKRGTAALDEGRTVLIFPEGTRTPYGAPTMVKKGGINLALEANALIVPVALNTGLFWAKGQFVKTPGIAKVSFGPAISVKNKDAPALQAEVKAWIDQEVDNLI